VLVVPAAALLLVVLRLSSWVAGGGHNAGNGRAGLVVGHEVSAGLRRYGRRGAGEQLALDGVVDQAEAEGLAARFSIALRQAVGCRLDASWLAHRLGLDVAARRSGTACVAADCERRAGNGGEQSRYCDDGGEDEMLSDGFQCVLLDSPL